MATRGEPAGIITDNGCGLAGEYSRQGFDLTGWVGIIAALDTAAISCISLMAIVAVVEECKISY